jgi:hypothetical protein
MGFIINPHKENRKDSAIRPIDESPPEHIKSKILQLNRRIYSPVNEFVKE